MVMICVVSGWAGVSEEQQEGFRVARSKTGKQNAVIWLCGFPGCTWWGWSAAPHYNPNGSSAKHDADNCFRPSRLGVDYMLIARPSLSMK